MSQADRIRRFVVDHYMAPARHAGTSTVTVRAGDVHREMKLANSMPAVCAAIGSRKFSDLANVLPLGRTGPANGSNVFFRFDLRATPTVEAPRQSPRLGIRASDDLNLQDALVLVSCVKSKLPYAAPARQLYTSARFRKMRDLVEANGARWFILSARYGLVRPDETVETYDYTLNTLGVAERRAWAEGVLRKLLPELSEPRVVMLAGRRYWEFLVGPLRHHGIQVDLPLEHLRQGEQLAWLAERE